MQKEIRNQVLLDLIVSPWTLVPGVASAMMLLGAFANEGPALLAVGGVASALAAVGIGVTRYMLCIDKIVERAYESYQEADRLKNEQQLNDLDAKLVKDRDARTTEALRNLREIYSSFQESMKDGNITAAAKAVVASRVDEMFRACVKQLELTYALYQQQLRLTGKAKTSVQGKRNELVASVQTSVEAMGSAVAECITMAVGRTDNELENLRREMETNIRIAAETEDEMKNLDRPVYNPAEYE